LIERKQAIQKEWPVFFYGFLGSGLNIFNFVWLNILRKHFKTIYVSHQINQTMKKGLLLLFALSFGLMTIAQERVAAPKALRDVQMTKKVHDAVYEATNPLVGILGNDAPSFGFQEDLVGSTIYDLQSNASSPYGRLLRHDDGTFSAVWTRGTGPTTYSDRGAGYNYFDGTSWGPDPTARLETVRTGWPSIAKCGPTGEAVVSHRSGTAGLVFNKRANKGSGAWTETTIAAPAGASGLLWPRLVSSGTDNNTLHIIALTAPTGNGGTVYQGQDGAMVYIRSTDGGTTWSTPTVLPGLGSADYFAFGGDSYDFAPPQGDNIAFCISDNSNDLIVMRSADNGATWTKTVVWEHPYPMLNPATTATDTLYAPDAAVSLAFDNTGKLHLAFGVYRLFFTGAGSYSYYPGLSDIAYWNDQMPTYTGGDQMNILNPDSLYAQGKEIGTYLIDWDGNGELNYLDPFDYGDYGVAWASMPQLAFDDQGNGIFLYSVLAENFDNGSQQYRHIWVRASSDNGNTWGIINELSDDPIHMFDECVFPSIAGSSDELNWYFLYQIDNEPGLAVRGDEDPAGDNYINMYYVSKILNKVDDPKAADLFSVSANYPNPVDKLTVIDVTMAKAAPVTVTLNNIAGQVISSVNYGTQGAGLNKLTIDASNLSSGVYFYTVTVGQQQVTRKMIVK